MYDGDETMNVSRRTLLRASAGTVAFSAVGTGQVTGAGSESLGSRERFDWHCPEATLEPTMGHCEGSSMDGCADDHPVTVELQGAVQDSLTEHYPDTGALVDAGFKPYFDTLDREADGWSHWINPEYVADDTIMDPERPESVLVDNDTWRSIGVMFIATRDGEPVESPPAVYEADEEPDVIDGDPDDDGHSGADGRCSPWHYHAGLPGRFAWWYYRQAYEQDFAEQGLKGLEFPCRTPCMLHVWAVDHPDSVYAHDGPPREYRDQEPAEDAGFETDAEPGRDELDWDVLPDRLEPERRPDELTALVPGL